jgi:type IV secretory pathway VirB6-like protein
MIKVWWKRTVLLVVSSLFLFMPVQSRADIASTLSSALGTVTSAANCTPLTPGDTANWKAVSSISNIILSPINSAQSTISSKANSMAASATPIALILAGLLALSYFLWGILDSFAGGGDSFMGIVVGSLVPAVIVAACLGSYSSLVSTSGGLQGLLSSFTQAATGSSSASSAISTFMQQIFNTLASTVVAFFQALGCIPLLSWTIGLIAEVLLGSVIIIAALVFAVISVGELVGVMLTGILMVGIAVAVGPLFVACAVCKWSGDFFKGWLKFLLGASAYQMIISVVLSLVSSMLTSAQSQISSVNPATTDSTSGISIAGLLGLLGITWILTHLFKEIPRIASSLFGGGAMGHASFNKAANSMAQAGVQMAAASAGMAAAVGEMVKEKLAGDGGGSGDGGGGASGGGSGGSSGPSVSSESGSFTAAPQLAGPSVGDAGSFGGMPQLGGPDGGGAGGSGGNGPGLTPGGGGGDQWHDYGGGWEVDTGHS